MKQETLETLIISTKAVCSFAGPALLTYSTGIGQWANANDAPSALEWSMLVCGSLGTGILGLGSFVSSAFGKWVSARSNFNIENGNGVTVAPAPPKP